MMKAARPWFEQLLTTPSDFGNETGALAMGTFDASQATVDFVKHEAAVLVVGAGGLGCEVLKNLALSGVQKIDVVDMDTIDVTNLNRQFLFRHADVGKMKAEVAAEFVRKRVPSCKVTAHCCKIQDKPAEFYQGFSIVIGGLDNIEARRWLNAQLHELMSTDDEGNVDPSTVVPFIDGGSEAFKGQARVIVPGLTSCFECSLDSFPPQTSFPLCTVAETPRKPEHCVAWALFAIQKTLANTEADELRAAWDKAFGADANLDKDDPDHMLFLFAKASERAQRFHIDGVTLQLTSGVVKRIIPAIASTNAIIAAACVNEAWKYLSYGSRLMETYMMYNGTMGVYSYTFAYQRKENCPICCPDAQQALVAPAKQTLRDFIAMITPLFQLSKPRCV